MATALTYEERFPAGDAQGLLVLHMGADPTSRTCSAWPTFSIPGSGCT